MAPVPAWAAGVQALFSRTRSQPAGLGPLEAARRLRASRTRAPDGPRVVSLAQVVLAQLESPLPLLLVFAAAISAVTREWIDASLVLSIVLVSVGIGAFREYGGQAAAAALAARIRMRATIVRGGVVQPVAADEVVVGDVGLSLALVGITGGYVLAAETLKRWFYWRHVSGTV